MAPRATRDRLERVVDDLTFLVQTPEVRYSKRNLNAFVDALKRADYVRPYEGGPDEEGDSLEEQVAAQA
jgi:hypothetical protein